MNKVISGVIIAAVIIGLIVIVSVGNFAPESREEIETIIEGIESDEEIETIDSTQAGRNLSLDLEESLSFGEE